MDISLDFETRSPVDIGEGAERYASHPDTEIICLGWELWATGECGLWHAGTPFPLPLAVALQWISEGGEGLVYAVNAGFDRAVYDYIGTEDYGFPPLPLTAWSCVAAAARANALPGGLDKAFKCANDAPQLLGKDHMGSALIRACSIPPYDTSPEKLEAMGVYCERDVELMGLLVDMIEPLTPEQLHDYHVNERINDRGVGVDLNMARLAQSCAAVEAAEIAAELAALTGGVITKHTQSARMCKLVTGVLDDLSARTPVNEVSHPAAMLSMMTVYKEGKPRKSLDKAIRAELLDYDAQYKVLPSNITEAIELYDAGNASSVSKFQKMQDMAIRADDGSDRVHGAFIFAGAGQTLRYSSKGLQLHNFRRNCLKRELIPTVLEELQREGVPSQATLDAAGVKNTMQLLASMLRPAIVPAEGKVLVVYDWSAIEARVLPWLSGDPTAEPLLELFRSGADVYIHEAAGILNVPEERVSAEERQLGKVAILSLGFGGAVGALSAMARAYGMVLDEGLMLRVVSAWRRNNPWAVKFWSDLMQAFTRAYRYPGSTQYAGRVCYHREMNSPHVSVRLPCGTLLWYRHVKPDRDGYSYVKGAHTPKADAKTWPRARVWHGILAENITQAAAASLLRWLLRECDTTNIPIVAHTHDEVISEVPVAQSEETARGIHGLMTTGPAWAEGLPLEAEGGHMTRYGK